MREQRYTMEFRATAKEEFQLYGYAARFGTVADLGDFAETIEPGAFDDCLRSGSEIKCLFNHDTNVVLASKRNGTMALRSDDRGLYFVAQLNPKSEMHREVYAAVQRGDISECSFGFMKPKAGEESFERQPGTKKPLRKLRKLDVFDVSVVTFPAYKEGTSVAARSYFDAEARSALAAALGRPHITEPPAIDIYNRAQAAKWANVVAADRAAGRI